MPANRLRHEHLLREAAAQAPGRGRVNLAARAGAGMGGADQRSDARPARVTGAGRPS